MLILWKLLVAADLLLLTGYLVAVWKRQEHVRNFDYATIPVSLIRTIGLIFYAFSISAVSPTFWRFFLPVFVVSGAWEISAAVNTDDFEVGTAIGGVFALVLVGLTSVALYRLGGSHWLGI